MGRKAPKVILSFTDKHSFDTTEILAADFIWAVFLDGKPVNIRHTDYAAGYGAKYRRVSFANAGHAYNMVERMNRMFKTDRFKVHQLSQGPAIEEEK